MLLGHGTDEKIVCIAGFRKRPVLEIHFANLDKFDSESSGPMHHLSNLPHLDGVLRIVIGAFVIEEHFTSP